MKIYLNTNTKEIILPYNKHGNNIDIFKAKIYSNNMFDYFKEQIELETIPYSKQEEINLLEKWKCKQKIQNFHTLQYM